MPDAGQNLPQKLTFEQTTCSGELKIFKLSVSPQVIILNLFTRSQLSFDKLKIIQRSYYNQPYSVF